jgi:hypothetical protein
VGLDDLRKVGGGFDDGGRHCFDCRRPGRY